MPNVKTKSQSFQIALVGYGKQGKKLKSLFNETELGANFSFTILDFRSITQKTSDLMATCRDFDAFVITVPNKALADELLFYSQFEKPILIEKPLGNDWSDFEKINKINNNQKSKILVNYPFPYSKLALLIKDLLESRVLGEIMRIEVTHGHGHAWTSEYRNSWRSKLELGVVSMAAVHYLNYWLTIFGIPTDFSKQLKNYAKSGDAPDTGYILSAFISGVDLSIFTSYAIPSIFSLRIIGTEGVFHYDGHAARLFSPREVFSPSGRHVTPEAVALDYFDLEENWLIGQKKIIDIFSTGIKTQLFNFSNFDDAVATFKLLISN